MLSLLVPYLYIVCADGTDDSHGEDPQHPAMWHQTAAAVPAKNSEHLESVYVRREPASVFEKGAFWVRRRRCMPRERTCGTYYDSECGEDVRLKGCPSNQHCASNKCVKNSMTQSEVKQIIVDVLAVSKAARDEAGVAQKTSVSSMASAIRANEQAGISTRKAKEATKEAHSANERARASAGEAKKANEQAIQSNRLAEAANSQANSSLSTANTASAQAARAIKELGETGKKAQGAIETAKQAKEEASKSIAAAEKAMDEWKQGVVSAKRSQKVAESAAVEAKTGLERAEKALSVGKSSIVEARAAATQVKHAFQDIKIAQEHSKKQTESIHKLASAELKMSAMIDMLKHQQAVDEAHQRGFNKTVAHLSALQSNDEMLTRNLNNTIALQGGILKGLQTTQITMRESLNSTDHLQAMNRKLIDGMTQTINSQKNTIDATKQSLDDTAKTVRAVQALQKTDEATLDTLKKLLQTQTLTIDSLNKSQETMAKMQQTDQHLIQSQQKSLSALSHQQKALENTVQAQAQLLSTNNAKLMKSEEDKMSFQVNELSSRLDAMEEEKSKSRGSRIWPAISAHLLFGALSC